MITKAPACRSVCKDSPGAVMDELVESLTQMRAGGLKEADALRLVREPGALVRLFPEGSLGKFTKVAEAFVDSGCAECAVHKTYSK